MYAGLPVVAVNSGGPTESIVAGETGLLEAPEAPAFAAALHRLVSGNVDRAVRANRAHAHASVGGNRHGPRGADARASFPRPRVPAPTLVWQAMGRKGREHVRSLYSLDAFAVALQHELDALVPSA